MLSTSTRNPERNRVIAQVIPRLNREHQWILSYTRNDKGLKREVVRAKKRRLERLSQALRRRLLDRHRRFLRVAIENPGKLLANRGAM